MAAVRPIPFCFPIILLISLYSFSLPIYAQNLTVLSSWRKPNITTPMDQRISIASDAIQTGIQNLNVNDLFPDSAFGTPGTFFAQMAEFDLATNQTKYKDQLRNFLSTVILQRPGFGDQLCLNYALVYGYAAIRAYQAYKDDVFLGYAQTVWEFGQFFTLTEAQAKAGNTEAKSFPISSTCQGITMAGGSFWQDTQDDPSLNGLSTGYFLLLSALLGQSTSNQTYIDAATLSANFIHAHLYNINNVVLDTISAKQTDSCASSPPTGPYNSGLMIEGLAVLSEVTQKAEMRSLMLDAIGAAVTQQLFQGADGVISSGGGKSGDLNLVRGLVAAYNSNKTDFDSRDFLRQYIGVQYNAVLDQATVTGSNIYGSAWVGPPATNYSSDNQITSIGPLIAAIYLQNDTRPTNNNGGSSSDHGGGGGGGRGNDGGEGGSSQSLAGPIAGGIVGGLVFLALLAAGLFLFRRKQREKFLIDEEGDDGPHAPLPVPFMAHAPTTMASSDPRYGGGAGAAWGGGDAYNPHPTMHNWPSGTATTDTSSGAAGQPVPLVPLRREKQGFNGYPAPAPTSQSTGGNNHHYHSDSSSMSVSTLNRSGSGVAARPPGASPHDELPTAELVRLLNERLQPDQWNAEETPPQYHAPPIR